MKEKSYQYTYGWIRILACIFVITHHCCSTMYAGSISDSDKETLLFIDNLLMVNNGLFFMLSGKFALEFYDGKIGLYYKKRISKILIPFLLVIFVRKIFYEKMEMNDFLHDFFHGKITDWFVYAVIGFYLVAPFFYRMVQNMSQNYRLTLLLLILAFAFINSLNECYKPLFYIGTNPFVGNLSFFFIGYLLDNIEKLKSYRWLICFMGILGACVSMYQIVFHPGQNPSISGFCPSRIFMCMGIYVLIGWSPIKACDIVNTITMHIATLTYYIYLVHEIGQDLVFKNIPFPITSVYVGLLWTTFATILISIVLAEVLNLFLYLLKRNNSDRRYHEVFSKKKPKLYQQKSHHRK